MSHICNMSELSLVGFRTYLKEGYAVLACPCGKTAVCSFDCVWDMGPIMDWGVDFGEWRDIVYVLSTCNHCMAIYENKLVYLFSWGRPYKGLLDIVYA